MGGIKERRPGMRNHKRPNLALAQAASQVNGSRNMRIFFPC
jgi:hypothetical protein